MSNKFGKLPSEVLRIEDEYTAFCFDEVCSFILAKLESGEKPDYDFAKKEKKKNTHYGSFSEMYDDNM